MYKEITMDDLDNFGKICYEIVKNNKWKDKENEHVFILSNSHSRGVYNYVYQRMLDYIQSNYIYSHLVSVETIENRLALKIKFSIHTNEVFYIFIDQMGNDTRIIFTNKS